jgi:hypothetical protein
MTGKQLGRAAGSVAGHPVPVLAERVGVPWMLRRIRTLLGGQLLERAGQGRH